MYKIDLHTHSQASPDGGITKSQYRNLLEQGKLDFIAITDHDTIEFAKELSAELGSKIIVGEEISTTEGEVIGLFLKTLVRPGQSLEAAVKDIKQQDGLIYIPHPFENVRKGLSENSLNRIAEFVDIVEVRNGRALFQNRGPRAAVWAKLHSKQRAASSDAHVLAGIGQTYTLIHEEPTAETLIDSLAKSRLCVDRPPMHSLLAPKINRIRRRVGRKSL